jgi:zinc transport system substrate-binding protein
MTTLSKAQIYAKVGSGIDFELDDWMDDLVEQNKDILVIDCSQGITLIEMTGEHHHDDEESEQEVDNHEHGTLDPHIWMSPLNAAIMVQNICDGLVQVDPNNKVYYEENRDAYLAELTQLDQDISDGLSGVTNRSFMVYHPAFGYFAAEYDFTMIPIEDEGKEPTGEGIKYVIDYANEHNISVIFASPQFNQESAKVIADAIGGEVISIDPLARDYITNMRTLLDELERATESGEKKEVSRLLSWILFTIGVASILITAIVMGYNLVHRRKL